MDQQEKRRIISALDKYNFDMTNRLSPVIDGLVSKLKPDITDLEYSNITSTGNPIKKIELLVTSIRTRPHTFVAFCNALEEFKHDDLAKSLRGM